MTSPTIDRRNGLVGNVAMKAPVTVLAASNITLSGQQTVDGIAVLASNAAGVPDRVLCTAQTDSTQNGIWDVSTGPWTRSKDANGNYDLTQGTTVLVNRGTIYAGSYWRISTLGSITIGTTAIVWVQALISSLSVANFLQAGTGAVTRSAQDKMREIISAEDFGVAVGNTAAANTTGLLAMRNYMRDNPLRHFEVRLPRGLLQYTDAKWLHNVRSVTVKGGPTQMQNTLVSSNTTEKVPIWLNEPFLDGAGSSPGFGTQVNGYLINSAAKQSRSITLTTAGDASNFAASTWALVYGYNQTSSGYPPSMRYFEYRRIKSVVGAVVNFYELLQNDYRSDWVDIATNGAILYGKARILPLERAGFKVMERCELQDLEFLPSNGYVDNGTADSLGGSLYGGGCIELVVRNCHVNGFFFPTMGRTAWVEDSWIRHTEVDKLIDRVTFKNCEIEELSNGPACNYLTLDGGRILTPITSLNVRNFYSEGTRFAQDTTVSQLITPAASIKQQSIRIIVPVIDVIDPREDVKIAPSQAGAATTELILDPSSSPVDGYYNNMSVSILSGTGLRQIRTASGYVGSTKKLTVSAAWTTQPDNTSVYRLDRVLPLFSRGTSVNVTVVAATTPNKITCAFAGLNDSVVRGVGVGSVLKSTTTATRIKVSAIYYNGTNTVIEGQWSGGTPGAAEVFAANLTEQIVVENPTFISTQFDYRNNTSAPSDYLAAGNSPPLIDQLLITGVGRALDQIVLPFLFFRDRVNSNSMRINVNAVVTGFQVYVSDAYAGAVGTATLVITRPSTEGTTPYTQTINLKTVGGRRMDVGGTSTALSGDTLVAVPPAFHQQINLTTSGDLSDDAVAGYLVISTALA